MSPCRPSCTSNVTSQIDAESHVQPVRADEREKRRQEGAALRSRALVDEMRELVQLDTDEAGAEQPGITSQTSVPPSRAFCISNIANP